MNERSDNPIAIAQSDREYGAGTPRLTEEHVSILVNTFTHRRPGNTSHGISSSATAEHLRHLAFHGEADHVRALFETLAPRERARHADPDVLRQVALGSLARLRALPGGAEAEAAREREFLESVVELLVAECRSRGVFPRELFRTLLDWSHELVRVSRLVEAHEVCDLALTMGVGDFPDIGPWIQLRKAQVQMSLGHLEAAYQTLSAAERRRDRIADREAVAALLGLLGTVSLQTRRAPIFKRLLINRLRAFHTNAGERRTAADLLLRAYRTPLGLLGSGEIALGDKLLWLTSWSSLNAARRLPWRRGAHVLERFANGAAYVRQYGVRGHRAGHTRKASLAIDATLVTRAMGGLGDFIMMTPGLHALKAMRPTRPLILAIPRRFFPLFEGNSDVQLMDIDDDFDPSAYQEWFNLTDCPAARIESRTAPRVRANRIELFARGLGIRGARLKALDRRPRYTVTEDERAWRDEFFARHGVVGARVIGVQARTDEAYRDVPHMRQIVESLAHDAFVLVFGRVWPDGPGHPRVVQVSGLEVRRSFALASGCDAIVTPDSAFFHLAGALDLPCVGLFGPTDGRIRGHDYPSARVLDARRTLPCVPCWRNEITPCGLTGLRPSACLGEIHIADVVQAVDALICGAPRATKR